jgi:hypothetical protein
MSRVFHIPIEEKSVMQRFLLKSISGFRFWTFFLSIFEKGKYFCAKSLAKMDSEHNALFSTFQRKKV